MNRAGPGVASQPLEPAGIVGCRYYNDLLELLTVGVAAVGRMVYII